MESLGFKLSIHFFMFYFCLKIRKYGKSNCYFIIFNF